MKNKKNSFYAVATILIISMTLLFVIVFSPGVTSSVVNPIPEESHNSSSNSPETPENPDYSKILISKENVQTVIAAMARPTQYSQETVSTLYNGDTSKNYLRKRWSNGIQERIDIIAENGTTESSVLHSGKYTYMWKHGQTSYYRAKSGGFTPDFTQMTMVYQDILEYPSENIKDAKFTLYNSVPCIYVETLSPETGYRSRYWVSCRTGLLIFGQSLDADSSLIYSINELLFSADIPDSQLFLLPNGNIPETE